MNAFRLFLGFLVPVAVSAQMNPAILSAELESGNPELKICYDSAGAVALYKTRNWLFQFNDDDIKGFTEDEPVKPFFLQGFTTIDEFLNGRIDNSGKRISKLNQNLYPCGPNRAMTVDIIIVSDGTPKNWDRRQPITLDTKDIVWKRVVKIFETTPTGIKLLDEKAAARVFSEVLDQPDDVLLGWIDGRVFWCKKDNPITVYWRKADDRKNIHTIDLGGKMFQIFGVLKMKNGAIGMTGWREPRAWALEGNRVAGFFELTR